MNDFSQKSWTASVESISQLQAISKELGETNMSAAIRYCIKQVFNALQSKKEAG